MFLYLNSFYQNKRNEMCKINIIKRNILCVTDDVVDSWPFMSTPWPVLSTLAVYLLFVLKFGPKMMENRKPFNIKHVMLLYNAIQTLYNGWLVCWVSCFFFFMLFTTFMIRIYIVFIIVNFIVNQF